MIFKRKNKNQQQTELKFTPEILEEIKEYLSSIKELDFAITHERMLYVHTTPKLNLVSLGYHSARIEDITDRKIEIKEITNLYETDKDLAEILITNGNLILCKNEESLNNFRQAILHKTTLLKLVK